MSNPIFPLQKRPNTPKGAGLIDLSNVTIDNLRPALENFAQRLLYLEQAQQSQAGWLDLIPRRFAADSTGGVKTASFTPEAEVEWFRVNATGGAVVPTVPLAASNPYRRIGFIKTDSGSNTVTLTRSGSDTINGATTLVLRNQYQVAVLKSDGISAWDVEGNMPLVFSWTPVFTFATAGDLNVVYSTQSGFGLFNNPSVTAWFAITTSTFTHTTASGNAQITGLGYTPSSSYATGRGPLTWQGITKTNYTDISTNISASSATIILRASGSGQTGASITTADMPTGGTVSLQGQVEFFI